MSGKKQTSNKLGKKTQDQLDADKEKNDLRRKRAAYSHPLASCDEPAYKKSKHNLAKVSRPSADALKRNKLKSAANNLKVKSDGKKKCLQYSISSSGSDDDDDSDDENSSDGDDALSGNILNSSSQVKDKNDDDDSDDSSDSDNSLDGNVLNSSSKFKDKNDDIDDSSDDDDSCDSDEVLGGNKWNNSSKVNKINKDDNDDHSSSDEDVDSDEDESDSDNDKQELSTNTILPGKDKRNEKVAESVKDQNSIMINEKKTGNPHDEDSDDSDDDVSSDDDDDDDDDNEDNKNFEDDTNEKETGVADAESNSEDELEAVKKELANIPLEDLMKIKEKLGLKVFNKIMHGDKFNEKKKKVFKRENKNRPMEVSSKRKVPVCRQTDVPKEKVRRDPRFDDLSGEYQDKHFTKNYAFLNDVKAKEKLLIQKKMKKTKDENKKQELAKLLNRMTQQERVEESKHKRMELEKQWKEKERQLIKEGKTPYFLKKSDKKKLELAEKFKELQKSGQIDKYMSKRLKKNAQKEKKKLPGRHQRFT